MCRTAPRLVGCSLVVASMLAGCGRDTSGAASTERSRPPSAGGGAQSQAAVATANPPDSPCQWIREADIAAVVGPLVGAPVRVRSAESPDPQADGHACLYSLSRQVSSGQPRLALQVMLDGALHFEVAGSMMNNVFARELNDGDPARGPSPSSTRAESGWDYEGAPGPLDYVGRLGHVAVVVSAQSLDIPREQIKTLAARVRDAVPDRPFAAVVDPALAELDAALKARGGKGLDAEPTGTSSTPDPCALLSRGEAEGVLGKLTVAPYRSLEDLPVPDVAGPSCSYYSGRHRVLVLTPQWRDGKMLFGMARGVSGFVNSALGTGDGAAALPKGPWDEATDDTSGGVNFLKGDRMLKVVYKTSSTDRAGAIRLAGQAMRRF